MHGSDLPLSPNAEPLPIGQFVLGGGAPVVLIAGPCVIESRALTLDTAQVLKEVARDLNMPLIFKSSYDKANRTSITAFRGPGLEEGLEILAEVKETVRVPVLSDVHCRAEVARASQVLDVIQIPAFLCRQTDLLIAVAQTGRVVNVKKGQFLAPWDIRAVMEKIRSAGNPHILVTERGVTFGYNNLVVDFRSLVILRRLGAAVVFDATHSVQLPGGLGGASGGQREFVPFLARAASAVGIDALFMEVHPDPDRALCDGPNSFPLNGLKGLLKDIVEIDALVKRRDQA
jgi:2-dehydro-3-deoxyphosphooctonate aldolase (KDO 8-P synthase)